MHLTGAMLIGGEQAYGSGGSVRSQDAATGEPLEPDFAGGGKEEVARACVLAAELFDEYRDTPPEKRARFLEAIGEAILGLGEALIDRVAVESGLPRARLEGERARTVGQLRLFADYLRNGDWQGLRLDRAQPDRTPPRPDLRLRKIALGPVAVFGASNFPLAFSVAGGDTASALAAGCPVVAKARSGPPGHVRNGRGRDR